MAVDLNKYNTPAKKGVDLNKYAYGIPADSPGAQQYHPVNRLKSQPVTSKEPDGPDIEALRQMMTGSAAVPREQQGTGFADYAPNFLKAGYNQSLSGLLEQLSTGKPAFELPADYNPNQLEQIGTTLSSFLAPADLAAFTLGGGIGGAVGKAILKKALLKAMAKGAGSLGLYGTAQSALTQQTQEGEIDPLQLLKDAAISTGTGAALAGVGGALAPYGKLASAGGEIGALTGTTAAVEGRAPTLDDLAHSAGIVGGMRTGGALLGLLGGKPTPAGPEPKPAEIIRPAEVVPGAIIPKQDITTGRVLGGRVRRGVDLNRINQMIAESDAAIRKINYEIYKRTKPPEPKEGPQYPISPESKINILKAKSVQNEWRVKEAVESGKEVPFVYVEPYRGRPWADKYIQEKYGDIETIIPKPVSPKEGIIRDKSVTSPVESKQVSPKPNLTQKEYVRSQIEKPAPVPTEPKELTDRAGNLIGRLKTGQSVYVKMPRHKKIHRIKITNIVRDEFDNPVKIQLETGDIVKPSDIEIPASTLRIREYNKAMADVPVEQRAEVREKALNFDRLLVNEIPQDVSGLNYYDYEPTRPGEKARAIAYSQLSKDMRKWANKELGVEGDLNNPVIRAKSLPILEKYISELSGKPTVSGDVPAKAVGSFNLKEGDRVYMYDEWYRVEPSETPGNIKLKDGLTLDVDVFDKLPIEKVSQGKPAPLEPPKGNLKTEQTVGKSEQVPTLKEPAPTVNQKAEVKIPLTEPTIKESLTVPPEPPKAEPPATVPPKPPTKPVATTPAPERPPALTNAGIDYMREIANKTPLEKGQRQTWEQAGEKAISEGLDQRAVEIAEKVIEEKRMITTEEHAGMVMKYNELRREYNQVTDDISKAVERGESIENNLQKRRDAIEAQIDRLDEAVKIGGTPLGQALNIRKMRLSDQPMDVLSLTKEATARWKRKPTEAERLELKKFADSHAGREKLIDELWKQEEGRELIKAKVEAERQFEYEQRKARRTKAKENIDVEIADILKQIEKKGFHTRLHSTPLDPEMAYLTGKLAAAYIRKGGITLAGVVDKVRMHIPEITERNVYDALNTRNPKYQAKLRKVETERLRLMKQQANYLAKLEDAAEGKLTPPKPGIGKTTTVVATTEEIKALKRTVSDLRAKLSDTIMESRRLEKAQEILDKLRDQLINQYREVKRAPRKPIPSEALKSIREKIAEVKKELRLRDSIADLEEQIRTDQFKTPKKVEAKPLPENIERQLIEQKRLKRRVADYLRNKEKTRGQKIISETVNTIKTLQATADISATLRQGLVESVAHPGIAGRAQVKALKAMFNTYTAEQIDMSIRQHPNHLIRERAGLQLTEVGADLLSKREEMFGSNVLRKIPGLKHVVEASERHMTTYLNLLRVGVFDKFVEAYPNATTAELRAYADALNKITGRGDLGRAAGGKIGATLNATLFAPKFTASRFQAPWTIKKYWSMPRVRNQIAKDFAKTIAAGAGILALAKLAGYAVNIDDPRNPDWGKIKVGNTTYDVWGGFLQPARMMARLLIYGTDRAGLTGQMKTDQEKYGIEPLDIIENFAEYKTGPVVNIPNQLLTGKSMVGEKLETPQDWALQNLTAFWLRDAYDAYQDAGFGKAAGVSLVTILGVGANTYELSEMKTRREIKRLYYREGKKKEAEAMRQEWNDKHPDQQIGTNLSDPLKAEKIRQIKAMYQKKGLEAARDLLKKINNTYNWNIKEEDIQ